MIICPHCGWDNPAEAAFCTNCGRGLGRARGLSRTGGLPELGGEIRGEAGRRFRALDAAGRTSREGELPLNEVAEVRRPPTLPAERHDMAPTMLDFSIPVRALTDLVTLDADLEEDEPEVLVTGGEPSEPRRRTPTDELVALSPGSEAPSVLIDLAAPAGPAHLGEAPAGPAAPALLPPPVLVGKLKSRGRRGASAAAATAAIPPSAPDEPAAAPAAPPQFEDTDTFESLDIDPGEAEAPVRAGVAAEPTASLDAPEQAEAPDDLEAVDASLDIVGLDAPAGEPEPDPDLGSFDGLESVASLDAPRAAREDGALVEPPGPKDGPDLDQDDVEEAELEAELEDISGDMERPGTGELEVLRSGDLEAIAPGQESSPPRPSPPPLREIAARYLLRPLSQSVPESRLVPIAGGGVVIGRSEGDVRLDDDEFLSPSHARLAVEDGTLFIDDLDSLNGVWLRVRTEMPLASGDDLRVGRQVLRFEVVDVAENGVGRAADGTRRHGATVGRCVRLVQLGEDGGRRDVYHVSEEGCRIGRHIADVVFTDDNFMSGTHALLQRRGDAYVIRDLSSRNGTWIRVRGRRSLELGDAVMLGQTVWRVGLPVG